MQALYITLLLAAVFWFATFSLQLLNFWLSMCIAVTILTALALRFGGIPFSRADWNGRSIFSGFAAAAALYSIFWLGNSLSQFLFQFAKPQIASIYGIRTQGEAVMISLILLFITSPGEEIFWRGFVQRRFVQRFGEKKGWLVSSAVYAGYGGTHFQTNRRTGRSIRKARNPRQLSFRNACYGGTGDPFCKNGFKRSHG